MSKFPFLVIDQNQLQKADSIADAAARCRDENLQLLISDGAGFELSKGSEVFHTWRKSCEYIRQHADLIAVSRKMTEMMRSEIRTERPIESLVDAAATASFKELLNDLSDRIETSLNQLIDGPVQESPPPPRRALAERHWTDCAQNERLP